MSSVMLDIIQTCCRTDELTTEIYRVFAESSSDSVLADFWTRMSGEESRHVSFWKDALQRMDFRAAPSVFEDAVAVLKELKDQAAETEQLTQMNLERQSLRERFLTAFRVEFYLLHPAFEILFHSLGPLLEAHNPEEEYAEHIHQFLDMLAKRGEATPELELIGKSLDRVWQENRKLAQLATRDPLTGLLNRRGFHALAFQLAALAAREHRPISVFMVDIDRFKRLNDRFGHRAGDEVICQVADSLIASLRASDIVCRWGGEEFMAFLPATGPDDTLVVAGKLRENIAQLQCHDVPVTVRIGVAGGSVVADSFERELNQFILAADKAMLEAKQNGRNRVRSKAIR